MKVFSICGLAAAAACLAWGAQAQQQPYNPPSSYGYYGPGQPDDQYQNPNDYAPAPDQYQGQYQGQYQNGNAKSYQDYQQSRQDYDNAMSAYDDARNSAAQQREEYENNAAGYRDSQRAYHHRLREYQAARAAYDEEYGPGAYERYYGPPPMEPYPY